MAHYAFLDNNNIVTEVIVGNEESNEINWEEYYGSFRGQVCKRTSYNTYGGVHQNGGVSFRKNYAGIGFKYDELLDAFIPPKPYDSWVLNENTCLWEAPIPKPDEENIYSWDEENLTWQKYEV